MSRKSIDKCLSFLSEHLLAIEFLKRHTATPTISNVVREAVMRWRLLIEKAQDANADIRKLTISGKTKDGESVHVADLDLYL